MNSKVRTAAVLISPVILFFVFNIAEFEPLNKVTSKYFQSAVFSFTFLIVNLKPKLRMKVFYLTFFLFFVMIGFYLFNRIDLANSIASIWIGMVFITALSYLPQLVRNGFVEKL